LSDLAPHQRTPLAVVTGASKGFGLAVALGLSAKGWGVITIARSRTPALDRTAGVSQVQGDIANMDLAQLMAIVGDRPVDLLVNNAGVGGTSTELGSLDRQELELAFSVNVVGPARVTASLLPNLTMAERPLVINISSRLASLHRQATGEYRHLPTSYAYRITKAAQNMLSVCMAGEFGDAIRVWAVHPGRLRTALAGPDADADPAEAAGRLVSLIEEDSQTPLAYLALDEGPLPW
jgi:NAD(P)-dependent dehydrogenase (short-subunit alcohol dehydrogenase family)